MDRKLELPEKLLAPPEHTAVDSMVERAVRAQKAFQDWPEEQIDQLLQALAEEISLLIESLQTLAAFSATLRNEVNLDQLREELVAVVQETMQPSHVSLWVPPAKRDRKQPTA
jgi:hypothetical protein